MRPLVIGLDSSTTASKALAFDAQGGVVAQSNVKIPLSCPQPGYFEQDPDDWWRSAARALSEVAQQINPGRIVALAVSNQRETFVPLDPTGTPLRPAIVWLDERCKDMVEVFSSKVGRTRLHRITGKPPDYAPVLYRLAWMKLHETNLFKKIHRVCDVHTYLAWRLSGEFRTSWASADPLGLMDLRSKTWSQAVLQPLGMDKRQLPEAFCPGTVIGRITPEASRSTGLERGTPIVAGGGDGQCAGLGSNILVSTRAYLNLGTAVVAGVFGKRYRADRAFRTMLSCSENGYYYECSLRAGTFAVDWLLRQVLKIDPARSPGIYAELESEAKSVKPGSDGVLFLPYLCGAMNPYWDMNARGAFVGLTSYHGRGHLYRAILEGIAFEQALALQAVEAAIGSHVREVATIGGGSTSDLWCRIFADVTGKTLEFQRHPEASALGAAIAAAVGARWYPTFSSAAVAMTGHDRIMHPDAQNRKVYRALSVKYSQLYRSLKAFQ